VAAGDDKVKVVATNRKARHKFVIEDSAEAGLELKGSEVKSLREGKCSIEESYARPVGGEIYIFGMHIPPYEKATVDRPDPMRRRKVLLHRREISRLAAMCEQRGYTLVPLKVYFREGWAKVELALARSKTPGDKRRRELMKEKRAEASRAVQKRQRRLPRTV
jgi:SsrA-binding protein